MTPKEKAQHLVLKFTLHAYGVWDKHGSKEERYHSKQCALIAVNEIIEVLDPEHWGLEMNIAIDELNYWRDVKQEIESL
jgi:hypothetical protein